MLSCHIFWWIYLQGGSSDLVEHRLEWDEEWLESPSETGHLGYYFDKHEKRKDSSSWQGNRSINGLFV